MSRRNRRLLFFGGLLALTAYNLHRLVLSTHSGDSHSLKFERKLVSDPAAGAATQVGSGSAEAGGSAQTAAEAAAGVRAQAGRGGGAAGGEQAVQQTDAAKEDLTLKFETASGAFATGACPRCSWWGSPGWCWCSGSALTAYNARAGVQPGRGGHTAQGIIIGGKDRTGLSIIPFMGDKLRRLCCFVY